MSGIAIDSIAIEPPVHGSPVDIAGVYRVRLSDGRHFIHPIKRDQRISLLKRVVRVLFEQPIFGAEEEE